MKFSFPLFARDWVGLGERHTSHLEGGSSCPQALSSVDREYQADIFTGKSRGNRRGWYSYVQGGSHLDHFTSHFQDAPRPQSSPDDTPSGVTGMEAIVADLGTTAWIFILHTCISRIHPLWHSVLSEEIEANMNRDSYAKDQLELAQL